MHWQFKMEGDAGQWIVGRPEPTAVGFDNRTADRQSHPGALGLGREERLEEESVFFGRQAFAAVLDVDAYAVAQVLGATATRRSVGGTLSRASKAFRTRLTTICSIWTRSASTSGIGEASSNPAHLVTAPLQTQQVEGVDDQFVEVMSRTLGGRFADEVAQVGDDQTGTPCLVSDFLDPVRDFLVRTVGALLHRVVTGAA